MRLPLLLTAVLFAGCGGGAPVQAGGSSETATIRGAEKRASPEGWRVLVKAREMTIDRREIIQGGCWDYINAVYLRAGFPEKQRATVFKKRKAGPYIDPDLIRPGDWLYFVNHSYGDIEHSGLFVDWVDRKARRALILSYAGERRREPARYQPYDIRHTYTVFRPKAK